MNDYSTDLFVSLTDWHRLKTSSFQMSALYIYEYKSSKSSESSSKEEDSIKAVAFAGSYRGEIIRFFLYKSKSIPASCSFGHSTKVVDFTPCKLPIILDTVASLSTDGTICLWNVSDGICINKFENLLPNGCQHIAISPKAIELGVVSGAFSSVYVINIFEGIIMQQIRPYNSFVAGIGFYSTLKSSWLFTMDSTGIATYTSLTLSTAKSHKLRLFSPKKPIFYAKPNSDFTYLLAASANIFYIVSLTVPEFTTYTLETDQPIAQIAWVDTYTAAVLQMNGHFTTFKVTKPKFETAPKTQYNTLNHPQVSQFNLPKEGNEETHMIHARVISNLLNLSSAPITSSIQTATNYQSVHQISRNTVSNLDPFSNEPPADSSPSAKPRYHTIVAPSVMNDDRVKIVPPAPSHFELPDEAKEHKKKHHHHKNKGKDKEQTTDTDLNGPGSQAPHHKKTNFFKRLSTKMGIDKKHKTIHLPHHHRKHKHDKQLQTLSAFNTESVAATTTTTVFMDNVKTYNNDFDDQMDEESYSDTSESDRSNEEEEGTDDLPKMGIDGNAELRSPCISGFNGGLVIGFDDTISIEKHDFRECSMIPKHAFENDDPSEEKSESTDEKSEISNESTEDSAQYLTAQCFIWVKKPNTRYYNSSRKDKNRSLISTDIDEEPEFYYEIAIIVEGYNKGKVQLHYLNQRKEDITLSHSHKGKVVALFTTQKYIFTSGEDCFVHIYEINNEKQVYKYVRTLYQFTSPVVGFYRSEMKTSTIIDHSLFCLTRGSIVSMLDLKTLENKRMMSGHDSHIKDIYFHPASMMLLIECNSLYFWSLASSNLESIVTDQKKFMYLQNIKNSIKNNDGQFVRIVPVMNYRSGIILHPLKIGSVVFQVPLINLEKLASITRSVVKENLKKPMEDLAKEIPNFHFIYSLFTTIGITQDKIDNNNNFANVNKDTQFQIGLVGNKKVVTLLSSECQMTHETIFKTSSLITSMVLATNALFSIAFNGYKHIKQASIQNLLEEKLKESDSAIFHLLQYLFGCSTDVHDLVFRTVSQFSVETRRNWMNRLYESKLQFPNYRRAFTLIKCSLAETMIDEISEDEGIADVNDLFEVIDSESNASPYARRIASKNVDYFVKKLDNDKTGKVDPEIAKKTKNDFFNYLLLKVAENAPNSEADSNSLYILFKRQPIRVMQKGASYVSEGNIKAGVGFIRQYCAYILDYEERLENDDDDDNEDDNLYCSVIKNLIRLFVKLNLDDSAYVYQKLAHKTKRMVYSTTSNVVAFGSISGVVFAGLKYRNSLALVSSLNLKNKPIKSLKFDSKNKMQIAASYVAASKKTEQKTITLTIETSVVDQNDITGNKITYDDEKQDWVQLSSNEKVRLKIQ
ncbi:hypothetical protein M9Y10_028680 [Tritrichomonas musculus]|uniref:EF-hand domain-containing protein n=1 Tax=Tritrichomonas musculus TaxID=1915356 RepID=A0ABR2KL51_9EUKA